jgi:enterochelin esterase-like enzyme
MRRTVLAVALVIAACSSGGETATTTTQPKREQGAHAMAPTAGELVTEALEYDGGRLVTVYVPSEPAEAIVFAADGAWHLPQLSDALEGASAPPTMIVGVHGLPDDDGRLHEYVPGFDAQRFAAHENFFVNEVRRWVASRFGVALPPARTGVWGASLGGELALAMGLRHPDVYGVVLAASPGAGYQPPGELPSPLPRVYLVAGRQEEFFLDNATRWADALRNAEADVVMIERDGGHGGAFWREEFPLMVAWAFGH